MSYHKIQKQIDKCKDPEKKKALQDRLAYEKEEQAKGTYAQGYQDFKYQVLRRREENERQGKEEKKEYAKLKAFIRELMWELKIKENPQKMITFRLRMKSFIVQNCPSYECRLLNQ